MAAHYCVYVYICDLGFGVHTTAAPHLSPTAALPLLSSSSLGSLPHLSPTATLPPLLLTHRGTPLAVVVSLLSRRIFSYSGGRCSRPGGPHASGPGGGSRGQQGGASKPSGARGAAGLICHKVEPTCGRSGGVASSPTADLGWLRSPAADPARRSSIRRRLGPYDRIRWRHGRRGPTTGRRWRSGGAATAAAQTRWQRPRPSQAQAGCCDADPGDGPSSPLPTADPGAPPPRPAADPGAPPLPRTGAGLGPSPVVAAWTQQQRAPPSLGDADVAAAGSVDLGSGLSGPLGLPGFFFNSQNYLRRRAFYYVSVGRPPRLRPQLTVTFDPRRLSVFARLG